MLYRPLPPGLARRLLEGHENELTPLAEERLRRIKTKPCPRCQSAMHPYINAQYAFSAHDPLPRTLARCTECRLEWDPLTDLIVANGRPQDIEDPFVIKPGTEGT
jgi:hypothetical protein